MDELDNILKEFLVESYENLDQLDRDLVALETDPGNVDTLASIFRTIHTIKGTCGFLGLAKLESVTHVGENLLGLLRDKKLVLDAERTTALLKMVDAVRGMLKTIEQTGSEDDEDYSDLIQVLTAVQEDPSPGESAQEPAPPASEHQEEAPADADSSATKYPSVGNPIAAALLVAAENALLSRKAGDPAGTRPGPAPAQPAAPHNPADAGEKIAAVMQAASLLDTNDQTASGAGDPRSGGIAESSIRVDVGLLDALMNLVGELVLARNQILQFTSMQEATDSSLTATTQRLNLITTELQEGVMKTRMQPIGNIWSKFPRVVRDLGLSCGKKIRIEMEGKETELDKTIIEAIKDPLTHLVRNAADHGIEMPAARVAAGKPEEGRLLLRAFHEGGQVNIEIIDDGGGIDAEKIKQHAFSKGLITADHAARMREREALGLIFLPGFSTAEKVSNISGRGVGMDVVKTNTEKIGGTVDIFSTPGRGTTVKMKIPLTLAIIPALVVTCDNDRYAIPQVSLLELVRLEGEEARKSIEMIHGAPVYRLRGKLLPLVYLTLEMELGSAKKSDIVNIVVLQAEEQHFGLVVEGIHDTEEIVVKPLGKQLKHLSIYSGATIMGDGTVALILDVLGLAQKTKLVSEGQERALAEAETVVETQEDKGNRQALLVFEVGAKGRVAMPLSMVARLEEFPRTAVEHSQQQDVVQYRGEIMPLIHLARSLDFPENGSASADHLQVVVYSKNQRSVGLVVSHILDIVEETITVERKSIHGGLLGSMVIQDRITDLLDVEGVIRKTDPEYFEKAETVEA